MSRSPVVILTALDLEYQAVREKLVDPRLRKHAQGTRFEVGRLAGGRCEVALAHAGKGNQSAAVLAERAIAAFTPAALLFVGVAGARRSHVALGDVVVATHIYAYHGGTSEDDGFKSRPRVWETSHAVDQIARHVARSGSWARDLPGETPKVHFGPIAAGEVVLDSAHSAHARWLDGNYNDALAVEMEGAGVAQAGHLNRALVAVIRGVSDRADGTKEDTDRARWQPRAVAGAAAFAAVLADGLADEDSGRPAETGEHMPGTNQNIAKGNAFVGVQAGTVYGGVRFDSGPRPYGDLTGALVDLRGRLKRARAVGDLDQDTYDAAEAELTSADEALRTNTPEGRVTLMLALKKIRGLIADVAELTAVVTAAIALARVLS
ncbi:5'-methylthioadenosine/S-adenosylhomocysteine nucleosidase [Actinomadura sp. DC4]|uniref:5'-methylthioadenosine/S-adenosylhomocysteine nucleosidase family protein n=1 Tax=Actinomadura sp. DC4 TaxID=3055069 RepID=UPI0025B1C3F1|nr:5'-methylthioadenosine/S-adenosylhomocysteine nucleosidase [Actinomadura sp. DC4]MDN3357919.1 5'-methylthioadenosine/S-adenosylhomocysteine nucleosidase [Actinomadura sp. DC4]